jgi:hypothetical protein
VNDVRGFIEARPDGSFLVGARDTQTDYIGPGAHIHADGTWLHIDQGDYEGAMLNIETLPFLRRALAVIAKRGRKK